MLNEAERIERIRRHPRGEWAMKHFADLMLEKMQTLPEDTDLHDPYLRVTLRLDIIEAIEGMYGIDYLAS